MGNPEVISTMRRRNFIGDAAFGSFAAAGLSSSESAFPEKQANKP
ncbi:hypothetical protein [Sunxiuqinia indica]|nr:hypothetical protein [Sunxiuqinia indica]